MKKIFTIFGLIFSISLFAQNGDAVVNALKSADAARFSSYFDNNVDVKLPKQNEMHNINKADATAAVKGFFTTEAINGFEIISQREMSGTMYIAGKLKSASQNFNITVMLKSKADNTSVITVRIN